MVYSAPAIKQCGTCGHYEDSAAKFCPGCGSANWSAAEAYSNYPYPDSVRLYSGLPDNGTPTLVLPENMPRSVPAGMARALTNLSDTHVPNFAHVRRVAPEVLRQKQVELAKMMLVLARERLFLLMHFALWAGVNVLGFCLALKCYNEFIGDEMTKIMIGCTPFWVFNILGLTFLVPIRGTRKSIARLKDQVGHLKASIDFAAL
ncbi:MAG TPA: hypothetical protein V6D22_01545 [Candidatus Obscuribacterales bacterium]